MLFFGSLNDKSRDGPSQCFRENPGHCSHKEPEVSGAPIYRVGKKLSFDSTFETVFNVHFEVDLGV